MHKALRTISPLAQAQGLVHDVENIDLLHDPMEQIRAGSPGVDGHVFAGMVRHLERHQGFLKIVHSGGIDVPEVGAPFLAMTGPLTKLRVVNGKSFRSSARAPSGRPCSSFSITLPRIGLPRVG